MHAFPDSTITVCERSPETVEDFMRHYLCPYVFGAHTDVFRILIRKQNDQYMLILQPLIVEHLNILITIQAECKRLFCFNIVFSLSSKLFSCCYYLQL